MMGAISVSVSGCVAGFAQARSQTSPSATKFAATAWKFVISSFIMIPSSPKGLSGILCVRP